MTPALATARKLRAFGYVPHAPAAVGRRVVELISFPCPEPDGRFTILARATIGDPTSLVELTIPEEAVDLARM